MNSIKRLPISGYEHLYEVDIAGNVYSLPKNKRNECVLKFKPDAYGYLRVGLSKKNICKIVKVHRLVAQMFIPNPDNLPQVNHRNGIKTDNRVENLEWATSRSNIRHAWALWLSNSLKGNKNGNSVLSDSDRLNVVIDYATTQLTQYEIAVKYGICQANVSLVIKAYLKNHILEAGLAIDKTLK